MPEPIEKQTEQESVNEFFNKLPSGIVKDEKLNLEPTKVEPKIEVTPEEGDDLPSEAKNRHIRRLEKKIQEEREASIALAERVKILSETEKFTKENPEVDPDIAKLFMPDDAGKQSALMLSKKLAEIQEKAELRAFERIQQAEENEKVEVKEAGDFIDSQLESLEERYGVKLPLGSKTTNEFLQLVEQLSPKDSDGEIKDYADFETTFEIYQTMKENQKPDNSRQREIASRSMQRSQSAAPTVKPRTAGWDGWKVDMGL